MGQTILITGANRGIGLALTTELLNSGHDVFATTRNPDPAKSPELWALKAAHGESLNILTMDVTSEESIKAEESNVDILATKLDILVNNAAVFPEQGNESISDMDLDWFRQAFETNVLGVVRVTRAFLPLLEQGTNPRIINISSGAGSITAKDDHAYYAYSTSKAALNMLTRAMAAEYKSRNIIVVAMTPGWVQTDMGGPSAPLTPAQSARAIAATITTGLTPDHSSRFIERTGAAVTYGW